VVDGKEPGVHGGWALNFKKIPPNRLEEENVLNAIAKNIELDTPTKAR
jgi:hypothetical protein